MLVNFDSKVFHSLKNIVLFQIRRFKMLQKLTVWVLIGKPVVFGVLVFKVRVAMLTLLSSEVLKVFGTIICVAQLVLIVHPWTILTSV